MKNIVIATFYKFVSLPNYETMRKPLLKKMQATKIKGTIILAQEGINGSFAGLREEVEIYYQYLRQTLNDLQFKETLDTENPFTKAKVKLRKEIVTMGVPEISPKEHTGTYLNPEEWHEFIQDPNVVLIDTRNKYEFNLGKFKNAINPNTENFRDFPEYVENHLKDKKNQKIAMYCTGGIRCEKSTSYLRQQGFENVYHLKDGILNYLAKIPEQTSLWEGDCFVFDERVALNSKLERVYPQLPQDYKHKKL